MFFVDTWDKFLAGKELSDLEKMVIQILNERPEYQQFMNQKFIDYDFGELNPFLQLSLFLALREQISIDSPPGIRSIYRKICQKVGGSHAENLMIDILEQTLSQSRLPDTERYLSNLNDLLRKFLT